MLGNLGRWPAPVIPYNDTPGLPIVAIYYIICAI